MRELIAMADGRSSNDWMRTSALMALIANVNRDPKKHRPFTPGDFDPYTTSGSSDVIPADITVLRDVFIDGKVPSLKENTP